MALDQCVTYLSSSNHVREPSCTSSDSSAALPVPATCIRPSTPGRTSVARMGRQDDALRGTPQTQSRMCPESPVRSVRSGQARAPTSTLLKFAKSRAATLLLPPSLLLLLLALALGPAFDVAMPSLARTLAVCPPKRAASQKTARVCSTAPLLRPGCEVSACSPSPCAPIGGSVCQARNVALQSRETMHR